MGRLAALAAAALVAAGGSGPARSAPSPSWASPQIAAVVHAGLMAPSVEDFRPDDPLTRGELATVVASLGGTIAVDDPDEPVTVRELDARLVTLLGLRPYAYGIRQAALAAGVRPTPWLGTETVARLLRLRVNHPRPLDEIELQVSQPVTRAEAAYSVARVLLLQPADIDTAGAAAATFSLPPLSELQRQVLQRALRFVGSPYVWAGTSEHPQELFGRLLPGGFDCSGLVWRVFKAEPFVDAPTLTKVLRGRTTYAMSGEVPRSARLPRSEIQPGDIVFFGARGPRSKPTEVNHAGIYLGNGWMVHSSGFGTTMAPLTGWYETSFAWARSPLAEAGLAH